MFALAVSSNLSRNLRKPWPRLRTVSSKRNDATCCEYLSLESRRLLAADSVLQWNEVLLDAIRASGSPPPVGSRAMAIVHGAIFEAVNSIDHSYKPYHASVPAHPKASLDAAVAAAAERTLSAMFPALQATFLTAYTNALANIPDNVRESQGVTIGRAAADQILALRANDGSTAVVSYTPGSDPGDWVPTPPAFAPALLPQWPNVDPWAIQNGSQFRLSGPDELSSVEYAANVDQVKDLGSVNSLARTAEQTEIAKIWAGGPGTATPPGQWNMIAQEIATDLGYSVVQNARLFALLNFGLADAAIAAWDSKYVFDFWRPITAIRGADTDGNPQTIADSNWTPLLTTPPFPAYTSGHSTFSGAASTILARVVGTDSISFDLMSEATGVANRSFTSLSAASEEAGISRIYGGIHFGFDNRDGLAIGRKIGNLVIDTKLLRETQVSAQQSGNTLFVHGTYFNDKVFVSRVGQNVIIFQSGHEIGRFDRTSVNHIVVNGGHGHDRIDFGGSVNATAEIFGGAGNDRVFGSKLSNWIYGESGNDKLVGGKGNDVIRGGAGDDVLLGLMGSDYLDGDDGFDWLFGCGGADTLIGNHERDHLFGGCGDDSLLWS